MCLYVRFRIRKISWRRHQTLVLEVATWHPLPDAPQHGLQVPLSPPRCWDFLTLNSDPYLHRLSTSLLVMPTFTQRGVRLYDFIPDCSSFGRISSFSQGFCCGGDGVGGGAVIGLRVILRFGVLTWAQRILEFLCLEMVCASALFDA